MALKQQLAKSKSYAKNTILLILKNIFLSQRMIKFEGNDLKLRAPLK